MPDIKRAETMAKKLRERFPGISGIKKAEGGYGANVVFLGDAAEGGLIDDIPACDYYAYEIDPTERFYIFGVHKKLDRFLNRHGWFVECYDPGTYLAYKL